MTFDYMIETEVEQKVRGYNEKHYIKQASRLRYTSYVLVYKRESNIMKVRKIEDLTTRNIVVYNNGRN